MSRWVRLYQYDTNKTLGDLFVFSKVIYFTGRSNYFVKDNKILVIEF